MLKNKPDEDSSANDDFALDLDSGNEEISAINNNLQKVSPVKNVTTMDDDPDYFSMFVSGTTLMPQQRFIY